MFYQILSMHPLEFLSPHQLTVQQYVKMDKDFDFVTLTKDKLLGSILPMDVLMTLYFVFNSLIILQKYHN